MKTLAADAIMARVTPVARKLVDAPAERIQTLGGVCLGFLPNTSSMYRSCERESAAVRDRRRQSDGGSRVRTHARL